MSNEEPRELDHDREPWTQQSWERHGAFEAFAAYRDQGAEWVGDRSLRKLAHARGTNLRLLYRWSRRHRWQERATAHDADLDTRRRARNAKAARDAQERHGQMVAGALASALMPIIALGKPRLLVDEDGNTIVNEDGHPLTVSRAQEFEKMRTDKLAGLARESARVIPALVAAERIVRGDPVPPGAIPASAMPTSPEDLGEKIAGLLQAMDDAGVLVTDDTQIRYIDARGGENEGV